LSTDPSEDPDIGLVEVGELLLNGWGYNWYRAENLMRADDLLLRNQADALLGDALAAFRRAEAVFRQKHAGPPSREHPRPEPERMAELHAFQAVLAELNELRTRLRGAAMPPDDKIIRRHREEAELLARLGQCDAQLAASAQALRGAALAITPAGLAGMPGEIEPRLRQLGSLLEQRARLLDIA